MLFLHCPLNEDVDYTGLKSEGFSEVTEFIAISDNVTHLLPSLL